MFSREHPEDFLPPQDIIRSLWALKSLLIPSQQEELDSIAQNGMDGALKPGTSRSF